MATFIALEGIDGSGKSTVQAGITAYAKDFDEENSHTPGLVDRLQEQGYTAVNSCEPGDYPTSPLALEHAFNKTGHVVHLAAERAEDPYVKGVLRVVRYLISANMDCIPEELYQKLLNGEPVAGLSYNENFKALKDFCRVEPTLRRKVEEASLRQIIRHALVHTVDGGEALCPDATGLLFLANHLVHCSWIDEHEDDTVIVSDRSKLSQYAYSAPRGDRRIWTLYEAHSTHDPDLTVLLTCDPEEAVERVVGRSKSEEKHWAGVSFMRQAQEAYLEYVADRPACIIDTTEATPDATLSSVEAQVRSWLSHNN